MNLNNRQILGVAALIVGICSFFFSAPLIQIAIIILAVACLV